MASKIDPITIEIIRNGFIAASDEMKINLTRTAYNPIIYEVLDFSVGLFDENGDMLAQSAGLPIFLGNLPDSVKQIIADVGKENMLPGDIYLINDTYTVGTHLNDVVVCGPIFLDDEGETLIGFSASRAHWLDVGAVSPGGWTTDTTEIYQEGIRLRSVQLMKGGEMVRDIYQILKDNVRYTESVLGDLRAQIAASHTGERRMREVVQRYGLETVKEAIQEMFTMEEEATRSAIANIPDGVYTAESFMDDDGVGIKNPKVKVTVTIDGNDMTIDLTGSAEQCLGPINAGYVATLSGARVALKALTDPFSPVNEGTFRPMELLVPDNCMFNAQKPAPSAIYGLILMTLIDTIIKALSDAIPERIPAAHYGDVCAVFIFGDDPKSGNPYMHVEAEGGGWGANRFRDGENVMIAIADGDTRNIPIEIVENKFPLRIERYSVREDSGGPGRYRGGLGHYRDYRILDHDARFTTSQERSECPPWGLFGGQPAATNRVVVNPQSQEKEIYQKATGQPIKSGSVLSVQTGGGGGYGNPLERFAEDVKMDVIRGYVSIDAAEKSYGVIIDPETFAINESMTEKMRKQHTN